MTVNKMRLIVIEIAVVFLLLSGCALLSQFGEPQNQAGIGQSQKYTDQKAGGDATIFDEIGGPTVSGSPGSTTIITHESWTGRILAIAAAITIIALLLPSPAKRISQAVRKLGPTPPFGETK